MKRAEVPPTNSGAVTRPKGQLMTTETALPIDIRNVPDPNIVEYVKASEIERGDQIIVNTTVFTVTVVTPYVLAYERNGEAVRTSGPGGHWPVLHILTNYGGLIRFPHEDVARLGRI